MPKNWHRLLSSICIILTTLLLQSCMTGVWTGMNLVYTRHSVYKKVDDFTLGLRAQKLLFSDKVLKQTGCNLDLAVFNGDVLLAGHLPEASLREEACSRLSSLEGQRRLFKYITIIDAPMNGIEDSWITTKIISRIIADSSIDPSLFKIITIDGIVYLMGDVPVKQAKRVIDIARKTNRVRRVVTLLQYYKLSKQIEKN